MFVSSDNPCPHLGNVVTIKLSEDPECLQPSDGAGLVPMVAETHFQMNYSTGEWKRIKKFSRRDGLPSWAGQPLADAVCAQWEWTVDSVGRVTLSRCTCLVTVDSHWTVSAFRPAQTTLRAEEEDSDGVGGPLPMLHCVQTHHVLSLYLRMCFCLRVWLWEYLSIRTCLYQYLGSVSACVRYARAFDRGATGPLTAV